MRKTIYNRFYEEMNIMSGIVKKNQIIQAFLLINQVHRAIEKGHTVETAEELYALLLIVADEEGIPNPFADSDQFCKVFSNVTGQIPWEHALVLDSQNSR